MMETRKIGIAGSVGAIVFGVTAWMVAPRLLWLAVLAGFPAGYLSYEFRKVCAAFFVALQTTNARLANRFTNFRAEMQKWWLSEPHPLWYPAIGLSAVGAAVLSYFAIRGVSHDMAAHPISPPILGYFVAAGVGIFLIGVFTGECLLLSYLMMQQLAFLGARVGERCFWKPFFGSLTQEEIDQKTQRLIGKGYREAPLTYRNANRWIAKGFGLVLLFLVWTLWVKMFFIACKAVPPIFTFAWKFTKHFFILIHSHERVISGIDGVLGGMASYLWLTPSVHTVMGRVFVVLIGGCLGAGVSMLHWEFISKRWLHVDQRGTARA